MNHKKMKLSKTLISLILSFFHFKKKLSVIKYNKEIQKKMTIDINHYKMLFMLTTHLLDISNMSLYYDYCISLYPSIPHNIIKMYLFNALKQHSQLNTIFIDNVHPFSIDIFNIINQNIILNITSIDNHKLLNSKEATNIKAINVYCIEGKTREERLERIKILVDKIVPSDIKTLSIKCSLEENEISDILYALKPLSQLEYLYLSKPYLSKTLEVLAECFPLIKNIRTGYESPPRSGYECICTNACRSFDLSKFKNIKELITEGPIEEGKIIEYNIEKLNYNYRYSVFEKDIYRYLNIKYLYILEPVQLYLLIDYLTYFHELIEFSCYFLNDYSEHPFRYSMESLLYPKKSIVEKIKDLKNLKKLELFFTFYSGHNPLEPTLIDELSNISLENIEHLGFQFSANFDIAKIIINNKNLNSIKIIGLIIDCSLNLLTKKEYLRIKSVDLCDFKMLTDSVFEFLLMCSELRQLELSSVNQKQIKQVLNNIDKWPYLKRISINARESEYYLTKEDIDRIAKCYFLHHINFDFKCFDEQTILFYCFDTLWKQIPLLETLNLNMETELIQKLKEEYDNKSKIHINGHWIANCEKYP